MKKLLSILTILLVLISCTPDSVTETEPLAKNAFTGSCTFKLREYRKYEYKYQDKVLIKDWAPYALYESVDIDCSLKGQAVPSLSYQTKGYLPEPGLEYYITYYEFRYE